MRSRNCRHCGLPAAGAALTLIEQLLAELKHPDVRALAWAIGSPSLFEPAHPAWAGALLEDAWAERELARHLEVLCALEREPAALEQALGSAHLPEPLGHRFERLVLFWQQLRPEVRAATRGLTVRSGGRVVGEFDVAVLREDRVIETFEVTVKFYLNLEPSRGMAGVLGPRAYDRMDEKFDKMTGRQRLLGTTAEGRAVLARWASEVTGEAFDPETLLIENHALSRGYVFHPFPDAPYPGELSPRHGRGLWQTDAEPFPRGHWRLLAGREWLGPYRGAVAEAGLPIDPRMPRMFACLEREPETSSWRERERRFLLRAGSGLLAAAAASHPETVKSSESA
ncbi:MAG: DUF1853 family protein [Casimicrobiaceae bacterium]|nr:DUF1853 family protein [Casimicrobiaceae bacterium]MCX8097869.1 DUF1853 family protein [Casimicrobiaceae bacterium]MDW8311340.1 DUF1853 family protein [Burkholderiales bacterium]